MSLEKRYESRWQTPNHRFGHHGFLLGLLLIPTLPTDDRWFLKMAFTFLGPFSAVLWYVVVSHLVLHRRAGYLMQSVIFVGTAAVIYLLLINGVYHL
jgi:hypothetical protein